VLRICTIDAVAGLHAGWRGGEIGERREGAGLERAEQEAGLLRAELCRGPSRASVSA
jgi:hypothetical protein